MSPRRIRAVATRVAEQFRRDRRTLGLLFGAPILVLALVGALWGSTSAQSYRVVVVNTPGLGTTIADALRKVDALSVSTGTAGEAAAALREGSADATIEARLVGVNAQVRVTLEGSDPFRNGATLQAIQAGILKTAASGAGAGPGQPTLKVDYLHGGTEYSLLDYLAPLLIGFFAFFLTFVLAAVSFLRERTSGTLERLLATPLRRSELVVGYLVGFGIFATAQAAIILGFTILVLRVRYQGNLATVFLVEVLLVIVSVSMGLFVSAFARTELQAVQFIPIVVLPQAFLSGLFVPVDQLAEVLRPFARIMPLTYAMEALRDMMIKGFPLGDATVVRDLLVLGAFAVVTIAGAIASIRREVA